MYSKKVMNNFKNPRNVGVIKNPSGVGRVGNPTCGDIMHMYIKVHSGKIKDIKFQTFGCVAAVSTSSMITQLAKGKTLALAKRITMRDVADALDGLPKVKMHCSSLAREALGKAIEDYEKNYEDKNV